jgi:Matrixin
MKTIRLLALSLLPLLAAAPVAATSYVPMTDGALVDQAPVIAVVAVQGSNPGGENLSPFTGYRMRVERVLKGAIVPGFLITVRVPGGVRPDGLALRIWGAPRFTPGERALVFLFPRPDGTYSIGQLMLGAFHEVRAGGYHLAVRRLSEAQAITRPGEPLPSEPLRDFDRFAQWVGDRARGLQTQANYQVASTPGLRRITDDFTLFEDPDDGYNLRWFAFDSLQSVPWYAHQDGQQGVTGGGFTEFQKALAAWNDDPATDIGYKYVGTNTNTNGLIQYDAVNTILFNDPNNEVAWFSCSSGGILAYGGPWYFSGLIPYQNTFYHEHANADIVTNNGLTCFFQNSPKGSKAAEELFAHELGHTLGLNHSAVNEALMRSFIHDDSRGAALHADDLAGVAALYLSTPSPTDFFTVTPCRLLDTRDPDGTYGGPALQAGQPRAFAAAGQCGIPSTAVALSINVTTVTSSGDGHVTLYPAGWIQPNTSTLNFSGGQARANNAIVLLSRTSERAFDIVPAVGGNGTVHLVVDVNGYFEPDDGG